MSDIDINRVLQNIGELQDQNAIDFQQWKRLGQEIKRLEGKIKTSDNHLNLLMKKIKADYEKLKEKIIDDVEKIKDDYNSLKKIIVDENIQVQLNNKIEENKKEIDTKVNIETFDNSMKSINEQLDNKANLDQLNELSQIKRDKDDLIDPEDLSIETKKLLTSDKVAVVGEDSVGREELKDSGISYEKILTSHLNLFSNLNTKNIFDNYILDSSLGGFNIMTNFVFDDVIKIDGFNTIKGDCTSANALTYQINHNITQSSDYVFNFSVLTTDKTYIKPAIMGYKNGSYVKHLIAHEYIVNGRRDISIPFVSNTSLYDEYRFVFEVAPRDGVNGKVAWFGKPFVGLAREDTTYCLYDNVINKIDEIPVTKSPLYGKIISFNGDSISAGQGFAGGYGKIIAERNNMIYENISVNGSSITKGLTDSNGSPRNVLSESISKMRADADYVVLEGGINDAFDWKNGKLTNIGTVSSDYTSVLDNTTFCGAMEKYLRDAKLRFKGKKILYVIVHRIPYISSPYLTGSKNTFTEIRELIIKICNKYSIKYVDLFNSGLNTCIDEYKTAYTTGDGIHLNELGYRTYYVNEIESALISM